MEDLKGYVMQKGGLLVIHNGISFQGSKTFFKLVGASFITHPEYTKLVFKKACSHAIMEGIEK